MVTIRIKRMIQEILSEPATIFFEPLLARKSPPPAEAPNGSDGAIREWIPDDEEQVAVMDR